MDNQENQNQFFSVHLPFTLLALAFCLFFALQIQEAGLRADSLDIQKKGIDRAKQTMTERSSKNAKENEDRKAAVAQSEQIQKQFTAESQTVKDRTTTAAQFDALHKQIESLTDAAAKRKDLVKQSEETQKQFTEVMKDLNLVARAGDKDADLVIATYGIKINEPEAPAKPEVKAETPKIEEKKPQ